MAAINYTGKNLRTYEVSRHKHDFWEFIYCTGGDGVLSLENGQVIKYKQYQMVMVPPALYHENQSQKGFKNIHMNVSGWTSPFKTAQLLDDNAHRDLMSVMNMCYRYFNTDIREQPKIMMSLMELLENIIAALSDNMGSSQPVENMANMIIDGFSDPEFTVEEIYRDIPLSKDYLRRQFIKERGISPLQFLNTTRISYAQKQLLSKNINNYKKYEIADMFGFMAKLYFSRVFKKVTGLSPKAYTEKYGGENC
ncbi:MAG: AraC family transcriptional regulator [Clostridia bacterium]|nr:AraC family transcriptional regulator [Clostridia bacterium]